MLKQVTQKILLLEGRGHGRFPFCHSVLIRDRKTALIETGCGRGRLEETERAFSPHVVIFSHGHPDHCAGADLFSPDRLWGPREMKDVNGDVRRMARRFVGPDLQEDWISLMSAATGLKDFRVGNHFEHGHIFLLGDTAVEAVHAPGHTDDHYCFYLPREKIMLTTDIDFTSFGPWYANPESDIDTFIHAIERIKNYDMDIVISSHLGVIRDGIHVKFDRFLKVFHERDEKILDFLGSPQSMADFVEKAIIYRGYPYGASVLRFFEAQMIGKHLERLISRGLVREEDGRFVR